ncbi:MAG: enolase C-terminal domain-like protein [Bryobacteraceae bacterium]|nr:enolase C-terminal domain-like protein [Bryobacteraceae bacterium]
MRISEIRLHPIAIADAPLRSSYGRHAPYALRTIVELKTTDGITGISETYGGDGPLAALHAAKDRVLGMDPFRLAELWQDLTAPNDADQEIAVAGGKTHTWMVPGENPLDAPARTYAAYEVACLDIIGKAVGKPVCDVIGGRVRDAVPFSAYLFYKHGGGGGLGADAREDEYGECLDPHSVVNQCRDFVHRYGFEEIKLKGGVLDPEVEIATIRALREDFGPSYPLRIDPNCAWSIETSCHVGRSLKDELSDGGYLEDPCADLGGMAEVRRRLRAEGIDMPMASNVAVTGFAQVVEAKDLDAVQVVLSDPHYWGGIRALRRLSDLCETLGLGVSMHSNNHLGVSLMTMAHAAAAAPHVLYACDTHYPWQSERDEVIVGGRVQFFNGCVPIPDKPGLGVELDYDQVERCRRIYDGLTYRKRDDEAEMRQHVDPNWKRVLPRW